MDKKTFLNAEEKGKELENLIPKSRFVKIEGANHYTIILTKYKQLTAQVERFSEAEGIRLN